MIEDPEGSSAETQPVSIYSLQPIKRSGCNVIIDCGYLTQKYNLVYVN